MYLKGEVSHEARALPDRMQRSETETVLAAESFRDSMRKRHSVRQFSARDVPGGVIAACVAAAGSAPSGANHQPWHFAAIRDPAMKARIREAAEKEERAFYSGGAGDEWLAALEPIGTGISKPHLTACALADRGLCPELWHDGRWGPLQKRLCARKCGHRDRVSDRGHSSCGPGVSGTHAQSMKFLAAFCGRPAHEKAVMILPVGYPADDATVPAEAKRKKPLDEIMRVFG